MRISAKLAEALDEWAKEEGVSRNTLVSRELATAAMNRENSAKEGKGVRRPGDNPSKAKRL
ncbi:MAG: hypothetical protein LYZ70_05045 [Nitrososphaerales archaeon]|nr:hypothetical protein [Nitrososphaerales archaeon]